MSQLQTFRLTLLDGQPYMGGSPTFTVYCDAAGGAVTPPVITEIGWGMYGFQYDSINPRAYQIDGSINSVPRYFVGGNGNDLQAFGTYNGLGAPVAPAAPPTFDIYKDGAGGDQAQPPINESDDSTAVCLFVPSAIDIAAGRAYVVNTGGSCFPESYHGTIGLTEVPPIPPSVTTSVSTASFSSALDASAADFGTDVSVFPELSDGFTLITGRRVLAEMAYRRLTTARGQLAFYPDLGKDLRSYLGDTVTDASMISLKADIENELTRDERIRSAVATVGYNSQTQSLTAKIELDGGDGPFAFTLEITKLDIKLLLGDV